MRRLPLVDVSHLSVRVMMKVNCNFQPRLLTFCCALHICDMAAHSLPACEYILILRNGCAHHSGKMHSSSVKVSMAMHRLHLLTWHSASNAGCILPGDVEELFCKLPAENEQGLRIAVSAHRITHVDFPPTMCSEQAGWAFVLCTVDSWWNISQI